MSIEATFHFLRTEPVKETNAYSESVTAVNIIAEGQKRLKQARDAAKEGVIIELVEIEIRQSHRVPNDE